MWYRRVVHVFLLGSLLLPLSSCYIMNMFSASNTTEVATSDVLIEESRKKKKKNQMLYGLILGAVLVKMILFPLAVKAMAVMSSVSVLLSTMSLIMSSIVGYAKLAYNKAEPVVKLVHFNDIWAKGDDLSKDFLPDSHEYSSSLPWEQNHFARNNE